MNIKSLLLMSFILATMLSGVSVAGNPFNQLDTGSSEPIAMDAPSGEVIQEGVHPLVQYPTNSYKVIAVMVSNSKKIGLIRAKNAEEYFVRIGDSLGNSDGKISDMHGRGIEVSEENKIVSLLVRNRSTVNEKTE